MIPFLKPRSLAFIAAASFSVASAAPTEDGLYATFNTSKGEFTAKLFYEKAPISSANFIGLAEGTFVTWDPTSEEPVHEPFYDGTIFHRVIDGFMIQGGDPLGNGTGGPNYRFPDEVHPDLSHSKAGILSMANAGPNSNGSQFFVTLAAQSHLNGLHNVFGEVVEGLEVVQAIGKVETNSSDKPSVNVVINSIEIIRIGDDALAFDPRSHVFPETSPIPVHFTSSPEVGARATFESEEATRYAVRSSDDLVNWRDHSMLAGDFDDDSTCHFDLLDAITESSSSKQFFDVVEIKLHQFQDVNGGKLTITSPDGEGEYIEVINFGEDFTGKYTVRSSNYNIYYGWMEIHEDRTQVIIEIPNISYPQGSQPIIQYFLTWTSETGGTVYIHDSFPRNGYVATGTFVFED